MKLYGILKVENTLVKCVRVRDRVNLAVWFVSVPNLKPRTLLLAKQYAHKKSEYFK